MVSTVPGVLAGRVGCGHHGAEAEWVIEGNRQRGADSCSYPRRVSEYQYYEFLAADRPLDENEIAELRALSTRARITPTSFVNEYHWGTSAVIRPS